MIGSLLLVAAIGYAGWCLASWIELLLPARG